MSGRSGGSPFLDTIIKGLEGWDYSVTSEITYNYNCFAYAADEDTCWWDPSDGYYWPENAPRETTLEAFIMAYSSIGYERCDNDSYDPAFEKIALYLEDGIPTHAAKQIDATFWTSKLGAYHDIRHPLRALNEAYGESDVFLRRLRRKKD